MTASALRKQAANNRTDANSSSSCTSASASSAEFSGSISLKTGLSTLTIDSLASNLGLEVTPVHVSAASSSLSVRDPWERPSVSAHALPKGVTADDGYDTYTGDAGDADGKNPFLSTTSSSSDADKDGESSSNTSSDYDNDMGPTKGPRKLLFGRKPLPSVGSGAAPIALATGGAARARARAAAAAKAGPARVRALNSGGALSAARYSAAASASRAPALAPVLTAAEKAAAAERAAEREREKAARAAEKAARAAEKEARASEREARAAEKAAEKEAKALEKAERKRLEKEQAKAAAKEGKSKTKDSSSATTETGGDYEGDAAAAAQKSILTHAAEVIVPASVFAETLLPESLLAEIGALPKYDLDSDTLTLSPSQDAYMLETLAANITDLLDHTASASGSNQTPAVLLPWPLPAPLMQIGTRLAASALALAPCCAPLTVPAIAATAAELAATAFVTHTRNSSASTSASAGRTDDSNCTEPGAIRMTINLDGSVSLVLAFPPALDLDAIDPSFPYLDQASVMAHPSMSTQDNDDVSEWAVGLQMEAAIAAEFCTDAVARVGALWALIVAASGAVIASWTKAALAATGVSVAVNEATGDSNSEAIAAALCDDEVVVVSAVLVNDQSCEVGNSDCVESPLDFTSVSIPVRTVLLHVVTTKYSQMYQDCGSIRSSTPGSDLASRVLVSLAPGSNSTSNSSSTMSRAGNASASRSCNTVITPTWPSTGPCLAATLLPLSLAQSTTAAGAAAGASAITSATVL